MEVEGGGVATCFKQNLADPRVTEIVARSGFDCVWLDLEHVGNSISAVEAGIWAAKAHDVDVVVRVPRGSYSDLIRPLELDATGIMVPHIMSLDDARAVARQTRFHPVGLRPLDGGNADGGYGQVPLGSTSRAQTTNASSSSRSRTRNRLRNSNRSRHCRDRHVVLRPRRLLPGDRRPGAWDHPRLTEARERIARVAEANGKFAGTVGSPANSDELIALGYRFISLGADVVGLADYATQLLDRTATLAGGIYSERPAP
ncbi:aldolase/citrate lyase family protein [Tessaracoccus coleopterorum]|uniref:aldolase/citrate lyase family protein n=1 Tax=Tessaracoccus coleopterorum TaxID=2714950 RepID=UPI001E326805|nr:aldolase/citrate lyase family protein [Tessaracoccus coleopterorum]